MQWTLWIKNQAQGRERDNDRVDPDLLLPTTITIRRRAKNAATSHHHLICLRIDALPSQHSTALKRLLMQPSVTGTQQGSDQHQRVTSPVLASLTHRPAPPTGTTHSIKARLQLKRRPQVPFCFWSAFWSTVPERGRDTHWSIQNASKCFRSISHSTAAHIDFLCATKLQFITSWDYVWDLERDTFHCVRQTDCVLNTPEMTRRNNFISLVDSLGTHSRVCHRWLSSPSPWVDVGHQLKVMARRK